MKFLLVCGLVAAAFFGGKAVASGKYDTELQQAQDYASAQATKAKDAAKAEAMKRACEECHPSSK